MFSDPCQKCNDSPAVVKLVTIKNNDITEYHLCQECAQEISLIKHPKVDEQMNMTLSGILSHLLDAQKTKETEESGSGASDLVCKNCGLSLETFQQSFLLGCAECYDTFREQLIPLIRKIHGSIQHTGKTPVRLKNYIKANKKITALKEQLEDAVMNEDYEHAAKLRDMIHELEHGAE